MAVCASGGRGGRGGGERGALMMFVLMALVLVGAITVTAIQIIGADVLGGVSELEADQVYNIAQAGVHYAIGQLQQPNGASTGDHYTTGTLTVTSGSTTLGTAAITVNCVDTTPSNGWAPPCASSAYPGYRRIISTGSLPVSGPSRTIVAVVKYTTSSGGGSGNWSSTFCGLSSVTHTADLVSSTIYGDIVSNGSITITPASGHTFSILGDPGSPQKYTGKLSAVGSITCGSGCSAAGGQFPGQAGPLCSAPTLPTFSPGASNVTVASGTTYTISSSTGYSFNTITLNAGTCGGSLTTLQIQTSTTDSTATTVVQVNSLSMIQCTRLMIVGIGKAELRIGAATGTSLNVNGDVDAIKFGVDSTNAAVPASRLTVWLNTNGSAYLSHASGGSTLIAPNGTVEINNSAGNTFYGAALGNNIKFTGDGTYIQSDTSGLSGFSGGATYSNFNQLMSWKDQ